VECLDSLSAHADGDELVDWLAQTPAPPRGASVVHGEALASDTFRRRLHEELGWRATVPGHGQMVTV
jgi:metallo-beta-lactamase family protein